MKQRLRGVILDFDGTMAETERFGHRVAYNQAFRELGLEWVWDETLYGDLLGVAGGKERLYYYLQCHRPELLEDACIKGLIADVHQAKVRNFSTIAPTIPLRPGVARLIREVHGAGLKIGIATTAATRGVIAVLAQDPEPAAMIDVIAGSESVERKKPAPDVYLWALEQLDLDADCCIAIEDSNVGLRAALTAAVKTVVTVSDYTRHDDFTGAISVLSDLGEPEKAARCLQGVAPRGGIVDRAFLEALLTR